MSLSEAIVHPVPVRFLVDRASLTSLLTGVTPLVSEVVKHWSYTSKHAQRAHNCSIFKVGLFSGVLGYCSLELFRPFSIQLSVDI